MNKPQASDQNIKVRTVSFRFLLLAVVLGLILASSISTTWLGARGLGTVIRQLLGRQIETTLDAVTSRVEDLFNPSGRLLQTFEKRIRSGTLPIADPIQVARAFAETLEFEEGIKWIYFGYADGRLAGALVDHGEMILNVSSPGGLWKEWKIDSQGRLEPFSADSIPQSFDARERNWFQLARDQAGIVWTPPYDYVAGQGRGVTVSQAVRSADGTLIGVVGVDLLLQDVTEYLKHLKRDYQGDPLVFSLHGQAMASTEDQKTQPLIGIIREKLASPGAVEEVRRKGGHLVMDFPFEGDTYIAGVRSVAVPGDLDCVSAIVFSRKEAFGALEKTIFHSILAAVVALGVALLAGFLIAGRIATPLKNLAASVARIGRFDLGPDPMPRSHVREIRALSDSIDIMRSGLQSFSRYVPVDIVRNLVRNGGVADLGGERREVTIMFCDLAGFTAYAENTAPEQAVKTLSGFFEDFGNAVDANSGVIDSFLGDGMMVVFNAPERIGDPAASACRAALQGIAAMRNRESRFPVRVGLHVGECLIGNVGTSKRFAYTAIGDSVNLASRLEGINKSYGTQIIASSALKEAAGEAEFLWRYLDRVAVVGRASPLDIYELIGFRTDASGETRRLAESYSAAFEAFLRRDFHGAAKQLSHPFHADDKPSQLLHARIARESSAAPESAWEGINRITEK